jgi:hypothetical protein
MAHSTKTFNKISALSAILILALATFLCCARSLRTDLGFIDIQEEPRIKLNTLLFSSIVDAFPDDIWFVKISLRSYIDSFEIDKDTTILSIRIQCSDLSSPVEGVDQERWDTYISAIHDIAGWARQYFNQVDVQCASTLAAAYCSALFDSRTPFLFLLEHDWLFLPQRINHSMDQFLALMENSAVSYLRFSKNMNNGKCMKRGTEDSLVERAMEGTKTTMEIVSDHRFSQNPHIASVNAMKLIASSECAIQPPVTHTRFEASLTEFCQRAFLAGKQWDWACTNCQCHLVEQYRPCRIFVYGSEGNPQTVFHMDGRRFHMNKSNKQGLFFGSMMNTTNSYLVGDLDGAKYVLQLGQYINGADI